MRNRNRYQGRGTEAPRPLPSPPGSAPAHGRVCGVLRPAGKDRLEERSDGWAVEDYGENPFNVLKTVTVIAAATVLLYASGVHTD